MQPLHCNFKKEMEPLQKGKPESFFFQSFVGLYSYPLLHVMRVMHFCNDFKSPYQFLKQLLGNTYYNFRYSVNTLNIRSRGYNSAQYYLKYDGMC